MNPLTELLYCIINAQLDIDEYLAKLPDLLRDRFDITARETGRPATKELVKAVITWENGPTLSSLETVLNEKFIIKVKPTPAVPATSQDEKK